MQRWAWSAGAVVSQQSRRSRCPWFLSPLRLTPIAAVIVIQSLIFCPLPLVVITHLRLRRASVAVLDKSDIRSDSERFACSFTDELIDLTAEMGLVKITTAHGHVS